MDPIGLTCHLLDIRNTFKKNASQQKTPSPLYRWVTWGISDCQITEGQLEIDAVVGHFDIWNESAQCSLTYSVDKFRRKKNLLCKARKSFSFVSLLGKFDGDLLFALQQKYFVHPTYLICLANKAPWEKVQRYYSFLKPGTKRSNFLFLVILRHGKAEQSKHKYWLAKVRKATSGYGNVKQKHGLDYSCAFQVLLLSPFSPDLHTQKSGGHNCLSVSSWIHKTR